MAWTKYQFFLAFLMVITGSINTLATKWADESYSKGRDGTLRQFNHPFLQSVGMFFGESLCYLAFHLMYCYYRRKDYTEDQLPDSIKGNRSFNPFIFLPPALCDMTATSLMYIGLNQTTSSSFQMLRGALIIFTGILSIIFLRRRLKIYEWLGIIFILAGLIVVGLNDVLKHSGGSKSVTNQLIGDALIIVAQILTASQMIIEEKFVSGKNVSPMQAVGWEGIFGFTTLSILLVPMYFIHVGKDIFVNPDGQVEDAIDGFYQIANSWEVATGLSGTVLSIAFFNFAGISVTKELSATTRTVLDSVRTIIIWVFSLLFEHEQFSFIKLGGFVILLTGMFLYNDVLLRPTFNKLFKSSNDELVIHHDDEEEGGYSQEIIS